MSLSAEQRAALRGVPCSLCGLPFERHVEKLEPGDLARGSCMGTVEGFRWSSDRRCHLAAGAVQRAEFLAGGKVSAVDRERARRFAAKVLADSDCWRMVPPSQGWRPPGEAIESVSPAPPAPPAPAETVAPAPTAVLGCVMLELMGHRVLFGRLSECTLAGEGFLRLDFLEVFPGAPTWQLYRPGSVYAITPIDEAEARKRDRAQRGGRPELRPTAEDAHDGFGEVPW